MSHSSLELHYHLRDGDHAMNAFIRNKCEAEALAAFVHVAQRLGIDLVVETSAFTEGGLKEIWKFTTSPKHAYTNLVLLLSLLIPNFVAIWNAPPKDKELDGINKEIAKLTVEEKHLALEKARLELQKLAAEMPPPQEKKVAPAPPLRPALPAASAPKGTDLTIGRSTLPPPGAFSSFVLAAARPPTSPAIITEQVIAILAEETKFTARRSNFFKLLLPYDKVTAVGWSVHETAKPSVEATVERKDFVQFILLTDKLPTQVIEEAVVQIAAPVITDSGMHWKGSYLGEPISFAMKDEAFKQMVMRREVSFQAGNAIRCRLEIEQKLDETGEPTITGYSVPVVIEKIDESGAVETPQGKRQRFYDKHVNDQQGLFGDGSAAR
ncbi:MAG TPA: hypothetical protein VLI72_02290 [Methylibium sp.]|nr:hypothetical protein [Methylibium sp.]